MFQEHLHVHHFGLLQFSELYFLEGKAVTLTVNVIMIRVSTHSEVEYCIVTSFSHHLLRRYLLI